jgi:DNA-binding transcriptional LysR family regulator
MDLNRTTTFVRVVETGGFTRAAETMGLPPSSISRSVARLEEELGVTLLERTTRKVSLTDAGKAFFERAREALAGLEEANALALDAAKEAHGVVRIAMPPEFGANAGPLFAAFFAKHPRIRIELTFTTRGAELVGDLVDVAVQIGRLPDSSLIAKKLGAATDKLYASPAYLDEHGVPRKVSELAKHDAILFRAVGGEARWELEGADGSTSRVDVTGRIVGDSVTFALNAALASLGIALLPTFVGEPEVRAKKLVNVLPRFAATTPAHVLTHGSRHLPRRVALVRDHLVELLSRACTMH